AAFATGAVHAQSAVDARWQPWLGCWQPSQSGVVGESSTAGLSLNGTVCVVPAGNGVDIVNIGDGKISERRHIDASGMQQPIAKEGCSGWQRAQWSSDERRVYLRSEFTCGGTVQRTVNGMIAMTRTGEWLDVQGIGAAQNEVVLTTRYRQVAD